MIEVVIRHIVVYRDHALTPDEMAINPDRPGIPGFFPAGGNWDVEADHLAQFTVDLFLTTKRELIGTAVVSR